MLSSGGRSPSLDLFSVSWVVFPFLFLPVIHVAPLVSSSKFVPLEPTPLPPEVQKGTTVLPKFSGEGLSSWLHLHYNSEIYPYQILDSYASPMPKKHFAYLINFVTARLKGCPRFHANTLVAVRGGISGR